MKKKDKLIIYSISFNEKNICNMCSAAAVLLFKVVLLLYFSKKQNSWWKPIISNYPFFFTKKNFSAWFLDIFQTQYTTYSHLQWCQKNYFGFSAIDSQYKKYWKNNFGSRFIKIVNSEKLSRHVPNIHIACATYPSCLPDSVQLS